VTVRADLFVSIVGTALIDALNPTAIVVTIGLLLTPNPKRRTVAFLCGVFCTYLSLGAGLLLLLGPRVADLIHTLRNGTARTAAEVLIGLSIVGVGMVHWFRRRDPAGVAIPRVRGLRNLGVGGAFAFGATATMLDAPTAFPYLGALGLLANDEGSRALHLVLLVLYNMIFVGPGLSLLVLWLRNGERGLAVVERFQTRIRALFADRKWAVPIVAVGLAVIGRALLL
jgi:cytochrome c biogenesis protein CcdA